MGSFFARVSHLLLPYRRRIVKAAGWILLFQVLALVEPYIFATVLDDLVRGGRAQAIIEKLALASIVLVVLMLVKRHKDERIRSIGNAIDAELNPLLLKKMLALPLSFHESQNSGRLMGKVIRGITKLVDGVYMVFHDFVPIVGQSLVAMTILLWIDWHPAVLVFVTMCTLGAIRVIFNRRVRELRKARYDLGSDIGAHDSQSLHNVLTTQAFAQEKRELAWSTEACGRYSDMMNTEHGTYERADLWSAAAVNVSRISVIALSANAMWHGAYGVGILAFTVGMAERLFSSCYRIGGIYARAAECVEPVSTLTDILAEEETVADPSVAVSPATAGNGTVSGRVTVQGVHFRYPRTQSPDGRPPDLRIPNLVIAEGSMLGIVGHTGSGKSTLVKLLLRFYDPQIGRLDIDGVDLREMTLAELRRTIGYVPQEVELYDITVAENIAYGRPDATRAEVEAAARAADAHGFITSLENGYDTLVGNKGMKLSGGQRQKVGIARALLLAPPILIFDEATSSVDSFSEREIQRTMEQVCKGRTAIIIAHRLSTVRRCHRILVMQRGEIIEAGTHDELMVRNGSYAALVRAQERADQPEPPADPKLLN